LVEPRVKLRVERQAISKVLAAVLANHTLEDVSVEDPPLEEVIAQVFTESAESAESAPAMAAAP
jgi:ABC-2 type transport system ATP-binding protein